MSGPNWQTSIQSTISFDFLPTILHKKWTKQVHPLVCKWWFLTHSALGQICRFLLLKPSIQLLAPDTLRDDTSDKRITSCHPKIWGPYFVHCHTSTSRSYLFMTPAYYQLNNSAGFWQQNYVFISFVTADILILPPTLNISSSSINGCNFTMLLHDFKHFPFPREIYSSPNCLL